MIRQLAVPLLLVAVSAPFAPPAGAFVSLPDNFTDEIILTSGLDQPSDFAFLPDGRIIVVERTTGNVRAIDGSAFVPTNPIGVIDSVNVSGGERGLLGVAVDPGWPEDPYIYVHYTLFGQPKVRIERYTLTGDLTNIADGDLMLDTTSAQVVLETPDNSPLHQGGSVEFGPDRMLYISIGDDGAACDAQDITVLKGKILRIDVSSLPATPGPPPSLVDITAWDNPFAANLSANARLVYAYGLRNPYSMEVDRSTGAVYIADVGGFSYEEQNIAEDPGLNFGWPFREGLVRHPVICPSVTDTSVMTDAVAIYENAGGASIITAGAYRSPGGASDSWPGVYQGQVFYSDFSQAFMRRLRKMGGSWVEPAPAAGQPNPDDWGVNAWSITDYEVGPDGSLYYLQMWTNFHGESGTGQLHRIRYSNTLSVPRADGGLNLTAYPSPSAGRVTFSAVLDEPAIVRLDLFDASGRRVRALEPGRAFAAGRHAFDWDGFDAAGRAVAPGVYLARWVIDGEPIVRRVVRLE